MFLPGAAFLPFSIESGPKHAQHERSTSLSLPCSFQQWIHAFLSFLARTWHLRLCFVSTIACDRDACDLLCASKQSTSLRRRSFCAGSNCHRGFFLRSHFGFLLWTSGTNRGFVPFERGFRWVEPSRGGETSLGRPGSSSRETGGGSGGDPRRGRRSVVDTSGDASR